jgi:hypothetical protein
MRISKKRPIPARLFLSLSFGSSFAFGFRLDRVLFPFEIAVPAFAFNAFVVLFSHKFSFLLSRMFFSWANYD